MIRSQVVSGLMALLLLGSSAVAAPPRELGRIDWLRDLDDGLARAKEAACPVLLLFQEVPG